MIGKEFRHPSMARLTYRRSCSPSKAPGIFKWCSVIRVKGMGSSSNLGISVGSLCKIWGLELGSLFEKYVEMDFQ